MEKEFFTIFGILLLLGVILDYKATYKTGESSE
jgi:hypothetical protein